MEGQAIVLIILFGLHKRQTISGISSLDKLTFGLEFVEKGEYYGFKI